MEFATKGDKAAAEMLPSWQVVFEVLKVQEKSHSKDKVDTCPPSTAKPQCTLKFKETASPSLQPRAPPPLMSKRDPLQSVGAFAAAYCPEDSEKDEEEDPLDTGFINPLKEPNLYPSIPHNNWVRLNQQTLREGELVIAGRIVALLICLGTQKQSSQ